MIRLSTGRLIHGCAICCIMLISGCTRNWQSQPLSMWNESRYKPMESEGKFTNGSSAQPLIPGTVPRGELRTNEAMYTGRTAGVLVNKFPFEMKPADLARGQERFNVYCSPCHGKTGQADGMIVQRSFPAPPDYRVLRLRNAPVGHFYDVMTNGYGVMYSYASRVPVEDRWRIAAYIRILQRSSKEIPPERPRSPVPGGNPGPGANAPGNSMPGSPQGNGGQPIPPTP